MSSNTPLRRTRGDLIATAVIAAVCVLLLLIAYFTAPIRQDELAPAAEEFPDAGILANVPNGLTESHTLPDASPSPRPLVVNGLVITYADNTITATNPAGEPEWTYKRGPELCGMASAWGNVVAVYRTKIGCGDVVSIKAATGQYVDTRSAISPEHVAVIASNDRVGSVGNAGISRAELWRSDLVRTVEYGELEARQEPETQPNPGCTLTSALTRTELLAITERCEDGAWLRFQKTTPEDSRKPEMHDGSVAIPEGAYLVGISQDAAAIHDPATSKVTSYDKDGVELASASVPESNLLADSAIGVADVQTADLPHHMSYFDGNNLLLLDPATLAVTTIYQGALGTGAAIGGRLLYASSDGIAVADWDSETVEKVIPVDRGGFTGQVAVASAGPTIVEKRGADVVVLDAS
ncbi:hypothetical protein KBX17_09035 [Corynebacterium sp. CCUG 65737]|uniref:Rv3212 family protein n=1 Tax=Corynebacterium sp. CCUG 65737 TaxID=2823889 RepID=UPI00210EE6E0|nr:hypothetical protein [Corynebacterium sp. CCUG 65737]MCQ4627941.1 hypothetical protein [Corynebacterium sp. CCUG 65737]